MGAGHLIITVLGTIITLAASFGAHRPWAGSVGEQLAMVLTFILLLPLSLLNAVLPRHLAPGVPVSGIVLTSVLWGGLAYVVARWRQARRASDTPPSA